MTPATTHEDFDSGTLDRNEWTERLVDAASDYESVDPETLCAMGCHE